MYIYVIYIHVYVCVPSMIIPFYVCVSFLNFHMCGFELFPLLETHHG